MNLLDYIYDFNLLEHKFTNQTVLENLTNLKFNFENLTQEELVEMFFELLHSINTTYSLEDVDNAYKEGQLEGYCCGECLIL